MVEEEKKKQPKIVVDEEKSQKQTVHNSVLGKLILSDHVCQECGTPVLVREWESCVKCGGKDAVTKESYKPKPKAKEEAPKEESKPEIKK